jgi:glutamate 5-kinase
MYINAKNTLITLLSYNVVPIVNENDTVATEEIKFGDNDQLAALVASLTEAERLVILSDVDGLYDCDPSLKKNARLISQVDNITDEIISFAGGCGSAVSTGGMYSKLLAAKKAVRSGITVNIINGRRPGTLVSLINGKAHGTEFTPKGTKLTARKGWIAFGIKAKGSVTLDPGAVKALVEKRKSLLPSGITSVEGSFKVGDAVACHDASGERIAKGLTNYSSKDIEKIMGLRTNQIEKALGYRYSDEVIHADNIVIGSK